LLQRKAEAVTGVKINIRRNAMTDNITEDVLALMVKGKASIKRGWVMTEILKEISNKYGEPGMKVAREFIIKDYCGIKEQ
jgi:hypothetical protein|tara:strand:+ start:1155 stop:1394 length:240 start_codon:yes stop_codon:yes gene_type:complete